MVCRVWSSLHVEGMASIARSHRMCSARQLSGVCGSPIVWRYQRVCGAPAPRMHCAAALQNVIALPEAPQTASTTQNGSSSSDTYVPSNDSVPPQVNVADLDSAKNFREHWSVESWKQFRLEQYLAPDSAPALDQFLSSMRTAGSALGQSGVLSSAQAAAYWTYHMGRMGFFATQGLLGTLLSSMLGQATSGQASDPATRLQAIFRRGLQGPVVEALMTFHQDYKNIEDGMYNLPWDMTTTGHRQYNPAYVVAKSSRFLREAVDILDRRFSHNASTDVWLKSPLYPDYYEKTFHFQTDGWLSAWSAKVYEVSTETLFVGRQDAMQRHTLLPLAEFMRGRDPSSCSILEVACGTGRFATFVKDNYPQLKYTAADLSPYYLEEARQNMLYWKRMRAPDAKLGGVEDTGVTFLQAPAENVPEPDGSHDVVFSVYLFHELPADVRKKVVNEMARCCKPGGLVIFTDSVQYGDRRAVDATLGNFGNFNEPYYRDYVSADIADLFISAGLQPDMKVLASTTKVLSFRKPM